MNTRLHISNQRTLVQALLMLALILLPGITLAEDNMEHVDSIMPTTEIHQKKKNIIDRFIEYLDDTDKPRSHKKFDVSFIAGPFYSNEYKFGIAAMGVGLYYTNPKDSACPPSNVTLYGSLSTSLMMSVGISGIHVKSDDGMRIFYDVDFKHFPTKFWGIGFDNCRMNTNETKYTDISVKTDVQALWRLFHGIYIGPIAEIDYVHATKIKKNLDLWEGQSLTTTDIGVGASLSYDTRDNLTAPEHGLLIEMQQKFFPRFLANKGHAFSLTEMSGNVYFPMWNGSTFAGRLHGRFTYGDTPWSMLSYVGGGHTLRGYYEGRYRDKNVVDITCELRQKIWKRWGAVVWGGVGSVFHGKKIPMKQLLPNAGVGLRWEFKKHVNVRLDWGFGRGGESAVCFGVNEAF